MGEVKVKISSMQVPTKEQLKAWRKSKNSRRVGQLEKLANNIETGKAPFDQQQKLTLDFYKSRIEKLEDQIEKLKDKIVNGKH